MHRRLVLVVLGLLGLLILVACATQATPTAPPPAPTATEASPPAQETPTEAAPPEEEEEVQPPARGCLSCHVLVDPESGRYTLAFEAATRAQARGLAHPTQALDGTSMEVAELVGADVCLQCHGRGTGNREGLGTIATRSLMDIVHPAHMFSPIFLEEFRGNCFNCHNVDSDGHFVVLNEAVEVNEKGIPEVVPIPGTLEHEE